MEKNLRTTVFDLGLVWLGLPQEYAATYYQTNTPIILIFVILLYYLFYTMADCLI